MSSDLLTFKVTFIVFNINYYASVSVSKVSLFPSLSFVKIVCRRVTVLSFCVDVLFGETILDLWMNSSSS